MDTTLTLDNYADINTLRRIRSAMPRRQRAEVAWEDLRQEAALTIIEWGAAGYKLTAPMVGALIGQRLGDWLGRLPTEPMAEELVAPEPSESPIPWTMADIPPRLKPMAAALIAKVDGDTDQFRLIPKQTRSRHTETITVWLVDHTPAAILRWWRRTL